MTVKVTGMLILDRTAATQRQTLVKVPQEAQAAHDVAMPLVEWVLMPLGAGGLCVP